MIQAAVSADSVRRVLEDVFSDPAYGWRDESGTTLLARRWWNALTEWLARLEGNHPRLFQLLIWGVVLSLAAIAVHAIWVLVRTTRARIATHGQAAPSGAAVIRNAAWYAREADRLFGIGRYAAAMQAEFVRLTLELDARDLLRFHPSKTPREYLPELAGPDRPRREFVELVRDLYRYAFGGQPCGAEECLAWRARATSERYAAQS